MSSFWHKLGSILGPIVAVLPTLGMVTGLIPAIGPVVAVGTTVIGTLAALVSSLEKAFPAKP